jgi:hypothetical protein
MIAEVFVFGWKPRLRSWAGVKGPDRRKTIVEDVKVATEFRFDDGRIS